MSRLPLSIRKGKKLFEVFDNSKNLDPNNGGNNQCRKRLRSVDFLAESDTAFETPSAKRFRSDVLKLVDSLENVDEEVDRPLPVKSCVDLNCLCKLELRVQISSPATENSEAAGFKREVAEVGGNFKLVPDDKDTVNNSNDDVVAQPNANDFELKNRALNLKNTH